MSNPEDRTVRIELTQAEADWLARCLSLVMSLSRHWDDLRTETPDHGNAILARVALAQGIADAGIDPDEWLTRRQTAR